MNELTICIPKTNQCKPWFSPEPLLSVSLFPLQQPNMGALNDPAGGGGAGGGGGSGMLDRSRMALCAFTFLFLSLNPLAALLCSSGSSEAGGAAAAAAASGHHAGRSVLGLEIAGTTSPCFCVSVSDSASNFCVTCKFGGDFFFFFGKLLDMLCC